MTDVSGLGRAKAVVVSFWVEVEVEEEEVGHSHKVKMGEDLMGTKFQTNVIDWVKSWWVTGAIQVGRCRAFESDV